MEALSHTSTSLTCVFYESGDLFGYALAYLCVAPVLFFVALMTWVIARREFEALWFAIGYVINDMINRVLKKIFHEVRPDITFRDDYGMPSGHAQCVWFCFAFCVFVYYRYIRVGALVVKKYGDKRPQKLSSFDGILLLVFLFGLFVQALGVSLGRVYLTYHTTGQVIAGAVFGVVVAVLWYHLMNTFKLGTISLCSLVGVELYSVLF